MALKQSVQVTHKYPTISANGYEPIVISGDYTTAAGLTLNDVIEMGILPAGYIPLSVKLSVDDMDTGAALTLDCGILSGAAGDPNNARTCGNEAFAGSTIGQTGGVAVENKATILNMAPQASDVGIGLKIATAAAGLIVGAKIRLTVLARPKLHGV